jgi:hypothetical protein
MCNAELATCEYKEAKICSSCYDRIHKGFNNAPIIHNGVVIGIAKAKNGNYIECILWDKFTGIEINNNGDCCAVIIDDIITK